MRIFPDFPQLHSLRKFLFRELFKSLWPRRFLVSICYLALWLLLLRPEIYFLSLKDLIKVCVGRKIISAVASAAAGIKGITKFVFSQSLGKGHACRRCNLFSLSFPTKKLLKSQKSNLFQFYCLCVLVCRQPANVMRCFDPLTWSFLLTPSFTALRMLIWLEALAKFSWHRLADNQIFPPSLRASHRNGLNFCRRLVGG